MPETNTISLSTGERVIELLPEEITVNEELNVRPWEGDPEAEEKRITALAKTIREEGLIQPVVVNEITAGSGEVEYHLIAGNRRRNAVALINAGLGKSDTPLKLKAVVKRIPMQKAFRQAIIENLHRKDFSPMDLALDIEQIKKRESFTGKDWSAKVAEYLGVSRAQVTQHAKLLTLPADVQKRIHEGELSAQAGFDLLDVKPEKRAEVAQKASAKAKAEEEAKGKGKGTSQSVATGKESTAEGGQTGGAEGEAGGEADEKGKTKRKHVLAAARETEGALEKPKARTRNEITQFFEELNGPAYGFANGAVRDFITYFTEKWIPGTGTDSTLLKKFDRMTEKADQGVKSKADEPPAPTPKPAKAKAQAKGKANAKAKDKAPGKAKGKAA